MLHRILASRILWMLVAAVATFMLMRVLVPEPALVQFLNYALIIVAIGLTVGYAPAIIDGIRERQLGMVGLYALGVALPWLAVLINRSWSALIRIFDAPWMMTSPVVSTSLFLFLLAGLLQLVSPGVANGRIPRKNVTRVGLVIGTAIAASVIGWSLGFGEGGFD